MDIFGIGYGGSTPAALIKELRDARVGVVVDVRERARCSWTAAFHKQNLSASLAKAGIEYEHRQMLGGESWSPEAVGAAWAHMRRTHGDGARVALLCSERDAAKCHRSKLLVEFCKLGAVIGYLTPELAKRKPKGAKT